MYFFTSGELRALERAFVAGVSLSPLLTARTTAYGEFLSSSARASFVGSSPASTANSLLSPISLYRGRLRSCGASSSIIFSDLGLSIISLAVRSFRRIHFQESLTLKKLVCAETVRWIVRHSHYCSLLDVLK